MKTFFILLSLMMSLSVLADSAALKLVLEQSDVEKLEQEMESKGYVLYQVMDKYAKSGVVPRCPCESVEMKFIKMNNGYESIKTYQIGTSGFGTNLKVTIEEVK